MRRKPGELVPLEHSILAVAVELHREGIEEFHGFQMAKRIKDRDGARRLTGYGTLYRALGRLREMGILVSRWEDQDTEEMNRPRRRYYHVKEVWLKGLKVSQA